MWIYVFENYSVSYKENGWKPIFTQNPCLAFQWNTADFKQSTWKKNGISSEESKIKNNVFLQ